VLLSKTSLQYRRSGSVNNKSDVMTKEKQEKRPEDWTQVERLQAIIATDGII
jgi:hypothetical protein